MSKKLMMNNYERSGNMQIQRGVVSANMNNQTILVDNLLFEPNVVIVRITNDISTGTHSLLWTYTPYGNMGIRTDSAGINAGVQSAGLYNNNGFNKGNSSIEVIDNSFKFKSVSSYGPIQQGDEFEWIAIKYE